MAVHSKVRRMYECEGKETTLFSYNGKILFDGETDDFLVHDQEEQKSGKVMIVQPGDKVIPEWTLYGYTA